MFSFLNMPASRNYLETLWEGRERKRQTERDKEKIDSQPQPGLIEFPIKSFGSI